MIGFGEVKATKTDDFLCLNPKNFSTRVEFFLYTASSLIWRIPKDLYLFRKIANVVITCLSFCSKASVLPMINNHISFLLYYVLLLRILQLYILLFLSLLLLLLLLSLLLLLLSLLSLLLLLSLIMLLSLYLLLLLSWSLLFFVTVIFLILSIKNVFTCTSITTYLSFLSNLPKTGIVIKNKIAKKTFKKCPSTHSIFYL